MADLRLLPLHFKVLWKQFQEERQVKRRFYIHKAFKTCDTAFKKYYRWLNPYRISKQFLIQKGADDVHVYGETPLTSLFQIAKECGISSKDTVIDLGCGRGRGAFFLSHWFDCAVLGIEWVPEFVAAANTLNEQLKNPKIRFICQDLLEADLAQATLVYVCGTCFDDLTIRKLAKTLEKLERGVRVITVSYPMTEYSGTRDFELIKTFQVNFPWGETEVFVHKKL